VPHSGRAGIGKNERARENDRLHTLRLFLGQQEDTRTSIGQVTTRFLKLTETVPLLAAKNCCDSVLRGTTINDVHCCTAISLSGLPMQNNVTYTDTKY